MESKKFFTEVFESKPDDCYITIFTLPGSKSKRFADLDKAAAYVESKKNSNLDIYVSCAFMDEQTAKAFDPTSERGSEEDICGITSFYMDIDFKSASKPDCPTESEALNFIKTLPFAPTLVVHTGNGFHVWWIFKEAVEFEKGKLEKVKSYSKRIQLTVKDLASKHGWKFDSTHDLARVLRIPGTKNYKDPSNPKDVTHLSLKGPKYADVSDFDDFIRDENQIFSCIKNHG